METIGVSIIVPIYQVEEEYLKKCINSLIMLPAKNTEIILVDDGANDSLKKICDEYSLDYCNITVIHKKNQGVSSARNTGIQVAKYSWLMFVDADDWVDRTITRELIKIAKQTNADMVGINNYCVREKRYKKRASISENAVFEKESIKRLLYDMITPEYDKRYNNISLGPVKGVWGKLYKKDIIIKNKIRFNMKLEIGEDACFNLDYLKCSKKVVYVNKYLYYYRLSNTSAIRRYRENILDTRLNLLKVYCKYFGEKTDIDYATCYTYEVLSCIVNCMKKYYCHPKNTKSVSSTIEEIKKMILYNEISIIKKLHIDYNFFSLKERILISIIKKEKIKLLYYIGYLLSRL